MKQQLFDLIQRMQGKTVLVIGDLLLDKYIWGTVHRISPEAPVPLLSAEKETFVPGGASNVANNIVAVGAKAKIIGIVGNDPARDLFFHELDTRSIDRSLVLTDASRPTIQKVRLMGNRQQLLRVDYEDTSALANTYEEELINKILQQQGSFHAVIVSDYAKGMITASFMQKLLMFCKTHNSLLIVDPKPEHGLWYKGATLLTPNHKEACELLGRTVTNDDAELISIGRELQSKFSCNILITRGEKGMLLFEGTLPTFSIHTAAREVYDVSGAGDTVVGMLTLALAAGGTLQQASILANLAAGIVVGKLGTATVSLQELVEAVELWNGEV